MFIPGMSLRSTSRFLYKEEPVRMRTKLQNANKFFLPLDIETRREETKVRLRWHEHWPARNSSKEAEEEVNVPTRIFRVQQVRAALTVHQRLTLPPLSEKYQTLIRSYERPVRFVFLRYPSLRRLASSLITLTPATMLVDMGFQVALSGAVRPWICFAFALIRAKDVGRG